MKINFFFEKAANIVAAVLYGYMAYITGIDWLATGRLSSLLFLVMESAIILFFLIRHLPKQTSMQPYDWFVAIMATCLPLLLRPSAVVHDTSILLVLQTIGILISITAVLFLNRSFGIVPANRGIKSNGLYRVARHPIYAGYVVTYLCFIVQNPSMRNILLGISFMIFLVVRIFAEERFLAKDPAYAGFMTKTRWRLIPYIF